MQRSWITLKMWKVFENRLLKLDLTKHCKQNTIVNNIIGKERMTLTGNISSRSPAEFEIHLEFEALEFHC